MGRYSLCYRVQEVKTNNIASITDNCGQTVTDPTAIAQAYADYFKEIPQKVCPKYVKKVR